MNEPSFRTANERSTRRLVDLVGSLDAVALATDTGEGWSVAMVLAHLAFWDRHTIACWRAVGSGEIPDDWPEPVVSIVNEALEAFLPVVPESVAGDLATGAAVDSDAVLAALPDGTVEALRTAGRGWLVDAWEHRLEHIAQIEGGLGRG